MKMIFTIIIVFLLTIIIWGFGWYWIDTNVLVESESQVNLEALRGSFGDKFGAVNALFSGMAFCGIIITLLIQRADLKETQSAMKHERFNNTFFQLLKLHMETTEKLKFKGQDGRDALNSFVEFFKRSDQDFSAFFAFNKLGREDLRDLKSGEKSTQDFHLLLSSSDAANIEECIKNGNKSFDNYLDDSIDLHERKVRKAYIHASKEGFFAFSHYLRSFYNIVLFVDESTVISEKNKKEYISFMASQISDIELVFVFYNCLLEYESSNGAQAGFDSSKMRYLLHKYDIIRNMNSKSVFHQSHMNIFKKGCQNVA